MDIFRVLSQGAYINKNSSNKRIINGVKGQEDTQESKLNEQVNKELDFFKNQKFVHKVRENNEVKEENNEINEEDDELTIEEVNKLRKLHKIKIEGNDIPLPIKTFNQLTKKYSLNNETLLNNLVESGFIEPTSIQSEAIPIIMNDKDLIACAPTGSGKTLSFLIPIIIKLLKQKDKKGIKCLILTPTKELSSQIFQELNNLFKGLNLHAKLLNKSLMNKLKDDNTNLKISNFQILIANPTSLLELINIEKIKLNYLKWLIFDEADKLFEGDFLKQIDLILDRIDNSNSINKLMFSATIPSHVEEISKSIMNEDFIRLIIGNKQSANQNIEQKLIYCGNEDGKLLEIRNLLIKGELKPPVIIFLQSIIRAKSLFHELLYDNLKVDVIHSEKTSFQRNQIIEDFKQGKIWILICTDILARGIDFKNINLVINYDVPNSSANYIHRIGRTGRNGLKGKALTFYTNDDVKNLKSIINVIKQSNNGDGIANWMNNISKISKNDKKNMKYKPIDRKKISTVPGVMVHKRKMKRQMINDNKKRNQ